MRKQIFKEMGIFQTYKQEIFKEVLESQYTRQSQIQKGVYFLRQGDVYDKLIIIIEGKASAEMLNPAGESVLIQSFDAPFAIAPAIIFADKLKLPVSIQAKSKLKIARISRDYLLSLFSEKPDLLAAFLKEISNKVHFLSQRLYFLSLRSIQAKIAHYLFDLIRKQDSETVFLPYSMTDLADYFAVSRPSLSTVFATMQRRGIIQKNKGEVRVIDKNALEDLCE